MMNRDEVGRDLTIEDGLAGESVTRIITDHLGQVWIGTSNGINRYNGKRLMTYVLPKPDSGERALVTDLCEGDGTIYAATKGGIYQLSAVSNTFQKIPSNASGIECLAFIGGKLYFGNRDGLSIYADGRVKNVFTGRARQSVNYSVRAVAAGADGKVWFLTKYDLNSYDPRSGHVTTVALAAKMTSGAAFAHLAVYGHLIYIGTKNNGLWLWDSHNQQLRQVAGVGNVIASLSLTPRHGLCVACDGAGAFRLDARTGKILETFSYDSGDIRHQLPTNGVYCYYLDDNGVNWLGFHRQGLYYTYHQEPLFHLFRFGNFTSEGLFVRSFLIHGSTVLMGTSEGLWFVDQQRRIVRQFTADQLGGAHLITSIAFFNGLYYIGSYDGGLRVLNPQTLQVSKLGKDPLLDGTTITALTVSPIGRLWIGCAEGVYILDAQGRLTRYTEHNARIYGGTITSIVFDADRQVWLSSAKGLSVYSDVSKTFDNNNFPAGFFNGLPRLNGFCRHDGNLVFYNSQQIFYTDPMMRHFGELRLPEGVLDESCYGMLDDGEGHYWISSESGLYRTNYKATMLQHFSYGEGLRSQTVNMLRMDGRNNLWIATNKGLMYVNARDIRRWEQQARYKVLLYALKRGTDAFTDVEEQNFNREGSARLTWNIFSQKLTFKVVLTDYARATGRIFEYRLDDGKTWTLVHNGEDIVLDNLFLGSHTIYIRLAGAPGTMKSYSIQVVPSWLAICELLLIIIALILYVLWRRYRNNTNDLLSERDEMAEALVEQEKELEAKEDNLLADTSHSSAKEKYERVHINDSECKDLVDSLRQYLDANKPYVDPNYRMSDLAEAMHVSPSKLSQVFNLYLKENYYEFINRYRLNEFKRLVADGESERYTLTALSERCGFKKSSFFSTFRRVEGMTPTEYMKRVK